MAKGWGPEGAHVQRRNYAEVHLLLSRSRHGAHEPMLTKASLPYPVNMELPQQELRRGSPAVVTIETWRGAAATE